MVRKKYDFSNTEDGFERIPEGIYPAYVFDAESGTTGNGDPKTVLTLKISDGEHKGRQLWMHLTEKANTMWKIKQTLENLGMEIPKKVVEIDWDEVLGRKCMVKVGKFKSNKTGDWLESVESILPYEGDDMEEGGDIPQVDDDDFDVPF